MTLPSLHNVISSPVSVDGPKPLDWHGGQTLDLFGQEALPVNRSALPDCTRAKTIPGTI